MLYAFTQIMDFVMNVNDPNGFTNYLNCMMLNISTLCYKIFITSLSFKSVATLVNYLTKKPLT